MDVRTLKNTLEEKGSKGVSNQLTSVSHWVRRIFDSDKGQMEASSIDDIETLEKLMGLKIVTLKKIDGTNKIVAELSKEGKELYMDFVKLGYYL